MNLNCIICSDLLAPNSEIYTTACGHIFHYHCLVQWIERSRTCPQCRNKATETTIHRIYFNLTNTDGIVDDVGTLQSKLDNLQFQVNLKEKDVKIYTEKYRNAKAQNAGLREEIKELESKSKVSESAIHALKDQISYFKLKAKENDRLCDEVVRLKDKLKVVENVQTVISGSRDEVSDMLRHNRDPHSLSLLVSTLKKELLDADKKYKHVSSNLKHTQNDVSSYRKEISEIKKENEKLRHEIEIHKSCDKQIQYLKKIIDQETKYLSQPCMSSHSDASLRRIVSESPAPSIGRSQLESSSSDITFNKTESPSVSDRVKTIMDSDSPYLPVKSSNVGLPSLLKAKYKAIKPSTTRNDPASSNLFKQPLQKTENVKLPCSGYSYDGFGGHSKAEEYPSPKPLIGVKRHKSASTITSTKFRKLAPNKKLSDFFSNRDE